MNTEASLRSLSRLISTDIDVKVVDIGANPIDGTPPYLPMLQAGHAEVVGFEPNPAALAKLNEAKGPRETYLPHAVGDGRQHTLNICAAPGMTSLLTPNPEVLNLFHGFPTWGNVIATETVDTVRLADVREAQNVDYIKMDIQGAELMVLKNAGSCLANAVVIHLEVEFLPLYKDQPLFGDVETFLRSQGFMFHRFCPIVSRVVQPLTVGGDIYAGLSQSVWADALFIRDITKLNQLSDGMLLKSAAILNDCYQSIDIVMHMLGVIDRRRQSNLAQTYLDGLRGAVSPQPRNIAA